jgi:dolichyl-phosphate beta-glucosyltransferase
MDSKQPFLSVIVPAYNEAERIGASLNTLLAFLKNQSFTFELIVVDDGSRDATVRVVEATIHGNDAARLIRYTPNRGKGYAVRQGMLASQGEIALFTDADLSTPVIEIANALRYLRGGCDIVIGSRALGNSQIVVYQPLYRRIAAKIFNLLRDGIVGAGISRFKDTQCGFKAFQGESARQIFSHAQVNGFMFDVEVLYLALKWNYRIEEMPVEWANVPGSKVRLIRDMVRMFKDLALIRLSHRDSVSG